MKIEKKRSYIRNLLNENNSRFVTVVFTKEDGSERTMRIQQGMMKHVKRSTNPTAIAAAETRKKNNPHLQTVYDFENRGVRSINLDTVSKIMTNGVEITFK